MNDDALFARCAWRLIPFMTLVYVVSFIDRANVAFAALTMNRDLGFSPAVFGFGTGIFFMATCCFSCLQSDPGTCRRAALDLLHHGRLGHALGRWRARTDSAQLLSAAVFLGPRRGGGFPRH